MVLQISIRKPTKLCCTIPGVCVLPKLTIYKTVLRMCSSRSEYPDVSTKPTDVMNRRGRFVTLAAAVVILFTVIAYFRQSKQNRLQLRSGTDKALRMRRIATPGGTERILKYHIQHISVLGGATLELRVLDSFITDTEKCKNCLPNYFLKSHSGYKSKYQSGTAVLIHHQKSGGTTLRKCLKDLLGAPDRLDHMTGATFMGSMHTDYVLLWIHVLSESTRNNYQYIEGPNVMGICDTVPNTQPCSYYLLLRDPIDRAVSTYFYCKVERDDQLCATDQTDASKVDIKTWVIHQRSFLFAQLTFDIRYCNMSRRQQQRLPCWYRQRTLMEETNLDQRLEFVLRDLVDRFAVIGMLDRFEESLVMFEEVCLKS